MACKVLMIICLVFVSLSGRSFGQEIKQDLELYVDGIDKAVEILSFTGTEELSRPYGIYIDINADEKSHQPTQWLGKKAYIVLSDGIQKRYFHGIVSVVKKRSPGFGHSYSFKLTLVPYLELLRKTARGSVIQNTTVQESITKVFERYPEDVFKYEWKLKRQYPKKVLRIQYRETDLNFVDRELEQYGIFYAFKHSKHGHTLVLTDYNEFLEVERDDVITATTAIDKTQSLVVERYTTFDFDFQKFSTEIYKSTAEKEKKLFGNAFTMTDWPAEFDGEKDAPFMAQLRMEESAARAVTLEGDTKDCFLTPGVILKNQEDKYMVTKVTHHVRMGYKELKCLSYFESIPAGKKFAPDRNTSLPIITGYQIAKVLSKKIGDPSDKLRIRFYWDEFNSIPDGILVPATQALVFEKPSAGDNVIVSFSEGDVTRAAAIATTTSKKARFLHMDILQWIVIAILFALVVFSLLQRGKEKRL